MKHRFNLSALLVLIGLFSCAKTDAQHSQHISVKEAADLLAQDTNIYVLDVRTKEEYESETGHLAKAHLIPVDQLDVRFTEVPRDKKIITYCRSGHRSAQASEILAQHGIASSTMDGGITQWLGEGHKTEKVISQ